MTLSQNSAMRKFEGESVEELKLFVFKPIDKEPILTLKNDCSMQFLPPPPLLSEEVEIWYVKLISRGPMCVFNRFRLFSLLATNLPPPS